MEQNKSEPGPLVDKKTLPKHVAIIMDGNGRWAQSRGLSRNEGHKAGVDRSEDIITCARETGLKYLTLYAFSKENWHRPQEEVAALMELLRDFLTNKKEKMIREGIQFNTIGDISLLPQIVQDVIAQVKADTANPEHQMVLTLALSYGGRDEVVRAVREVVKKSLESGKQVEDFNEKTFSSYFDTAGMPDPDLIIRTSGEHRVSNFLLWQGAYAEYFFEDSLWPDFTQEKFLHAISDYQKRERRFGRTSEQLARVS